MWVLVPWPGIKPGPPALWAQSLYHWTAREVPGESCNGSTRGMGLYSRDKGRKSNWINDDLRPIPWLPGQSFNKPNLGQGVPLGLGKKKKTSCMSASFLFLPCGWGLVTAALSADHSWAYCLSESHSLSHSSPGRKRPDQLRHSSYWSSRLLPCPSQALISPSSPGPPCVWPPSFQLSCKPCIFISALCLAWMKLGSLPTHLSPSSLPKDPPQFTPKMAQLPQSPD